MYSVRILRQAIQDISDLPKDYARLVSRHIDQLSDNPRPQDAKSFAGAQIIAYV
jgi:mRNA-degrading endonuclease RelE of RelBE toxin-antitoxin system